MVPRGEKYITKEAFCGKMGLLAYDCGNLLSNRIFEVIDTDRNGYVNLAELIACQLTLIMHFF